MKQEEIDFLNENKNDIDFFSNKYNTEEYNNIYKQLKQECTSKSFRNKLKIEVGTKCVNCGLTESIEYHHIVPLRLGGTNNFKNIVPLCKSCHKATHLGNHIDYYSRAISNKSGGRPSICDKFPDYKNILNDYVHCKITRKECETILNLSEATNISDRVWFKNYLKENDIKNHRNNILLILKKSKYLKLNREIGYIEYKDGNIIRFYATQELCDKYNVK